MQYDTGFQAAIASVLGSGQQSAKVTFVRWVWGWGVRQFVYFGFFENTHIDLFTMAPLCRIGEEGATVENQAYSNFT